MYGSRVNDEQDLLLECLANNDSRNFKLIVTGCPQVGHVGRPGMIG
jgi:hypothetical protein